MSEVVTFVKKNDITSEAGVKVRLGTLVIQKRGSFKYFRSIFQGNGEIGDDVAHCIGTGWMKWRLASGVL